jgi:predicted NAD/FAD-dependent oxidoreductase
VRLGERVASLRREGAGCLVQGERYEQVVIATPPTEAARLLEESGVPAAGWLQVTRALAFEPIATVYVTGGPRLPLPMLMLACGPGAPAQFVFDRGQLGGPDGVLAFVASASPSDREAVEREVLLQAAALGWRVQALQTVVEKRATFACTPGLLRPPMAIAQGLWACGDYVDGPYPATLEGAVRAGIAVAALLPQVAPYHGSLEVPGSQPS